MPGCACAIECVPMGKLPVTAILLTLNEEENLPRALESLVKWAEDIFLVDSLSTDRTVEIALERSVSIVQRPFTDFGDQWNWALRRLPIHTPWTIKVDPDELLSDDLVAEVERLLAGEPEHAAYELRRRLWFMGKPLNQYQWVLRLWRTGSCRFSETIVNEHPLVDGSIGRLRGLLEHFDSPTLHRWYDKQNHYGTMEAIMRVRGDSLAAEPRLFGTTLERRMFLKSLFPRLPLRYHLLWLYLALVKGAVLAGSAGLTWSRLRVEVQRAIDLKACEMKRTNLIPEIPRAPHGDYDPRVLATSLQSIVAEPRRTRQL